MSIENGNGAASRAPRPPVGRAFWGILAAAVIAVGVTGVFAQTAFGDEWGWRARIHGAGFGHPGMISGEPLSPADVKDRVEKMVAHLAIEVDATDEQKQKLTDILVGAADDLLSLREQAGGRGAAAHELIGLLTAPTVDPIAVEQFRAEKIAAADQASKRIAEALVDAAQVLAPEQRQKLGDRLDFLGRFGPPFHRG